MSNPVAEPSPRRAARIAGVFYLLTFVLGSLALVKREGFAVANLAADACYVVVAILFYGLFKPVSRALSLLALLVGLAGCAVGVLSALRLWPLHVSSLVFFGVYCLLIGALIAGSKFLPRVLGLLMGIGGLGWLTFASPALTGRLAPFNMLPGAIAEGVLTVWLLAFGVNAPRWIEQAGAAPRGGPRGPGATPPAGTA